MKKTKQELINDAQKAFLKIIDKRPKYQEIDSIQKAEALLFEAIDIAQNAYIEIATNEFLEMYKTTKLPTTIWNNIKKLLPKP